MEYDDPNNPINGPELPGVAPPSGTQTMPAPQPQQYGQPPPERPQQQRPQAPPAPAGPVLTQGPVLPPPPPPDPTATSILHLIQGGKFTKPFTVTLMRKTGVAIRQTAAGSKQEDDYKLCQITIREPSDLMTTAASIANGSYRPLNSNTLELQLLLFIAFEAGLIDAPPPPPPAPMPPPQPAAPQLPIGFTPPPGFMLVQTPQGFTLVPTATPTLP